MLSELSVPEAVTIIGEERDRAAAGGPAPLAVLTMSALGWWPHRDQDYRLMGMMGAAASIGLGLAIGRPDRDVWVLDGDGSLLMQLGVLAAVADAGPPNLTHIVIDNGVYAVSGGQPTPGARDWAALYLAAGYTTGVSVSTADSLRAELGRIPEPGVGPRGVAVRCRREPLEYPAGTFDVDLATEARRVRRTLEAGGA